MGTKGTTYLDIDGGGTRCRARVEDKRAADAIGELLNPPLARGIDQFSLVGGHVDATTPWLTPGPRARLRRPDPGALLARGRLDLPKRETDHEQRFKVPR